MNGTVRFTDSSRGYYEYTSDDGFSGKDSFTVRVTDKYGNRSVSEKITLRVDEPAAGEVYADMKGHYANAAVISCIRAGIINSASEGEYFYPDEYISRAEFLSLAMDAVGYSGLSATKTGFADDADIPQEYKGVVAAAHALGFVDGIESAEGLRFYPNNQITRSEAAVILSRLTGITSDITPVFSDMSVPAWAQSSVQGLNAAGILRGTGSGSIDAYASVTRGAAAQMLSVCMMH